MRILVTGGAGFIGSHTVDALINGGHDVRILDNLQKPVHLKGKPPWIPKDAEFILGDVRSKTDWEKALEGIEAVYHFAAYQDYLPDFSTFFHVNAVGTALLYETAVEKRLDLERVVVASSQFVQGEGLHRCRNSECTRFEEKIRSSEDEKIGGAGTQRLERGVFPGEIRPEAQLRRGQWEMVCPGCGEPGEWEWTPETHAAPPNAYAMAKFSQEQQALTFGARYEIPSVALRYSIVQGPRQSFYNAYSGACRIFCLNYYFGKRPTLYEDGLQCRDFVNIHDAVRANIMALEDERMVGGVFNVGGGRAYTIAEFAEIVREEVRNARRLEGEKSRRLEDEKVRRLEGENRRSLEDEKVRNLAGQKVRDLEGEAQRLPRAVVPGLYRFGDTRNACSDISKLKSRGWEPENSPRDSVKEYLAWLYEQDNVEDILDYAEKTMKNLDVIRSVSRR